MKKKIFKFINWFFRKPLVQTIFYITIVLFIFTLYGEFKLGEISVGKVLATVKKFFTSPDTLSVFLAALFSVFLSKVVKKLDFYLEESQKIDDNHHKIISIYNGHKKSDESKITSTDPNFYDRNGIFMFLSSRHITVFRKKELKNRAKDPYTQKYKDIQQDITEFDRGNGRLYLPTLNMFTNLEGNTKVVFNDSKELFHLPDFVMENARSLLAAHKNSDRTNNSTVRLTDFSYSNGQLVLDTQRSMYFHMLITNRCMDYEFDEGLTIRTVYEYNKTVSPLNKSILGNQIGINGLILSRDGYVLIEKRDHHKITWKNKYAQSISLALKVNDLKLGESEVLARDADVANEKIKAVIQQTIRGNFGLTPDDYETFTMEDNFLGLARDLLEGGKPNLYFYVTTKYDAAELAKLLETNAARDKTENGIKPLQSSKLDSDYYLVPYEDLLVNFNYSLRVNRRKRTYWIRRHVYPRSSKFQHCIHKARHAIEPLFYPVMQRECGEALLVTLAYLELCQHRIDAIMNK